MLTCDSGGFGRVTDGTSNTHPVCIEDAGRAHPNVSVRLVHYRSRKTPVSGAADPIGNASYPSGDGRRMFAWADADAVTNGFSGPHQSNAVSRPIQARLEINNYCNANRWTGRMPLVGQQLWT